MTPDVNDPQSAEHGLHAMLIVGYNDRQEVKMCLKRVDLARSSSFGTAGALRGVIEATATCPTRLDQVGHKAVSR